MGLLAAESHELGEEASRILGVAWSRLRESEPLLPESPTVLAELHERQCAAPAEGNARVESAEETAVEEGESADLTETSLGIDDVRAGFVRALTSAENIVTVLKEGAPPSTEDIEQIRLARDLFFEFYALVVREHGQEVEPTLAALEERLATRLRDIRLAELHDLTGPEKHAEAIAGVRDAAGDPESVAALTLLRDLLDAAARADLDEIDEISARAYQELPLGWRKLIGPIGRGEIALAPEAPAVPAGPPVDEESAPEARSAFEPVGGALAEEEFAEGPPTVVEPVSREPESAAEPAVAEEPESPEEFVSPAEPECVREPVRTALGAEAERAEAAALSSGRLALAAWIREADGRPEAEVRVRRAAVLASEVNEFAGRAGSEFADRLQDVTVRDLADDPAGRIMAFSAVVRVGLVSPMDAPIGLLEELSLVFAKFSGLHECGKAFAQAARQGVYVASESIAAIRDSAELERDRQDKAREAELLLVNGPQRKINYQKATEVLKRLFHGDRRLAAALKIASRDDTARSREAKAIAEALRAKGAAERLIDDTTEEFFKTGKRQIEAAARSRLVAHVQQACDTVLEWTKAVRACEAVRTRMETDGDWTTSALADLREELRPWRDQALVDVEEFSARLGVSAGPACHLLREAFALLDGRIPHGTGRPVADLLNSDLLLVPGLRLSPALEPVRPPTVAELLPVALSDELGWRAAFEERSGRRDHEGTLGIVGCVERFDAPLGAELRRRRDELVRRARADRDERIEALRDRTATWLRDGVLTEAQTPGLEKRLQELGGDRCDFGEVAALLDGLDDELTRMRADAMRSALAELDRRAAGDQLIAAVAPRAREAVEAGDLTTANEIVEQAARGNEPAEFPDRLDHFRRFFPAFPKVCNGIAIRSGNKARRTESRELLQEVSSALRSGSHPADPEVEALLRHAGIDIPALRPTRRDDLRAVLGSWQQISQGKKAVGMVKTWVERILHMLGVEAEQTPGGEDQHRAWIDLTGVRLTGQPLLPAFGSAMSPSGDSLRLLLLWRSPGAKEIIDLLKGEAGDRTVLVFYFGLLSAEQRMALARASRDRPVPVAGVVDDAMIAYLAGMEERDWGVTVSLMAPFTSTTPYMPVGDVPDEMFMGRDRQLEQVISRTGPSFVYGGRQLGKSALLRRAKNFLHKTDPSRVVILQSIQDIGKGQPVEQLWPELGNQLVGREVIARGVDDREGICAAVRSWCEEDPSRQLLILLDEVDGFLTEDARHGEFPNVIALRELMQHTERKVKVVFAGLHQTGRFQSLPNQPLAQMGAPIAIGPLLPQHAFDLLVSPLATLGFRLPKNLAARIIAETNNAPALVQLFAQELLARLRHDQGKTSLPYEITRSDVEAVWRDHEVVQGIRKRFDWTLTLDKRYKVIAYVVALHGLDEGFDAMMSAVDLREECEGWWPQGFADCGTGGFQDLLEECVSLGVLRADGEQYGLRTPHILRLLGGAEEVEKVLGEAVEHFELPDAFDANSYRAGLDEHERSPLTAGQMASLLGSRSGLQIVTGSAALRLDRVATALQGSHTTGRRWVKADSYDLDAAVKEAEQAALSNAVIYSPGPRDDIALVADRLARSRSATGGLLIVAILPARLSALWQGRIVELGRFNGVGIRQWLNEIHALHHEDVESVLRATSGWPTLVHLVADRLRSRADLETALAACRSHLKEAPAAFVNSTGVDDHPVLAAAWSVLVDFDPDVPAELADLLRLHGEEGEQSALADPSSHGFDGTEAVVEALRVLGALELRPDRRLACEPVLKEATLAARNGI